MRVLVLGASGMLGYTLYRLLGAVRGLEVHGSVRRSLPAGCPQPPCGQLHEDVDATDEKLLATLIRAVNPDVVVNCVGLIKQLDEARDPAATIAINSLLPHRLAKLCAAAGIRLIHFSTDCVFSGARGGYHETDVADANDLYGRSKRLGEIDYGGHLTLRTSIIGHGVAHRASLVDWFLGRRGAVAGFGNVSFSGLPTVEIARLLIEHILPRRLTGLYHLGAEPIDKDRLLRLVARQYGLAIDIERKAEPRLNRSLDSSRLREAIDYHPPSWEQMVAAMHTDYSLAYAPWRSVDGERL